MLVPRNLRLFRNNWAHDKTPIIQHHLRTSRRPVRNHLRYRIEIAPFRRRSNSFVFTELLVGPAPPIRRELKHDCVTRLDRDRAAGVNHAWNSRLSCRDKSPAVPMAYPCLGNQMKVARKSALKSIRLRPVIARAASPRWPLRSCLERTRLGQKSSVGQKIIYCR